jgi:hypothetical protein
LRFGVLVVREGGGKGGKVSGDRGRDKGRGFISLIKTRSSLIKKCFFYKKKFLYYFNKKNTFNNYLLFLHLLLASLLFI